MKETTGISMNIIDAGSSSFSSRSTEPGESGQKRSVYSICVTVLDLVNHALIILMTAFLLYCSLQSLTDTNLHVALCSVGYVLLMSEAIVVLAGESILTSRLSRSARRHVHWVLQILGLIFVVVGIALMYKLKNIHFQSTHAILGITSAVIMLFLAVFGYPVFIAVKLRKFVRPVVIKFGHNFLGTACFVIGMASQCYGYEKRWLPSVAPNVPHSQTVCIVLTVIIVVLSLRGALPSLYRQFVTLIR